MTQPKINLPAPIDRGYGDDTIPVIVQSALNEMTPALVDAFDAHFGGTSWRTGGGGGGGSREVRFALDLTWDATESVFTGDLYFSGAGAVAIGNILIFQLPSDRPDSNERATLRLGSQSDINIFDRSGSSVLVKDLVGGEVYWGPRGSQGVTLLAPLGQADIARSTQIDITNAQLKELDATYVELLPAPGVGSYLEVELLSIERSGDDMPPVQSERAYYIAISTDDTLSEAEVAAGNTSVQAVTIPTWPTGETRYVFVGTPDDRQDLTGVGEIGGENTEAFFTRVFEAVSGTVNDANGVPVKWWRTRQSYGSVNEAFPDRTTISGWRFVAGPIIETIDNGYWLGAIFVEDDSLAKPVQNYGGEYTWVEGAGITDILRSDDGTRIIDLVGGHGLSENKALVFGVGINSFRGDAARRARSYNAATFDRYMAPVDDVSLSMTIRHKTISI